MKTKGTAFSYKLNKQKADFIAELKLSGLIDELKRLASEKHYAISMLIDMLRRDYSDILLRAGLSETSVRRLLKENGVVVDNTLYLKLPQEVKLQFRYPAIYTTEQIREEQRARSRRGFDTMLKARKQQQYYHPKNHVEYWLALGHDHVSAEKLAAHERCRKSPHSLSFEAYNNMTYVDKKFMISRLAANRGVKGLEAMSRCVSTLEQKLIQILVEQGIEFETQKPICCSRELREQYTNANSVYMFDVYVPSKRLLIECNGTYWHADPRVYTADQVLHHPGKSITAAQIWEADALKMKIAKMYGYDVFVLWELDIMKPGYIKQFIAEKIENV